MSELTLGPYLKRERERRGLTLRSISEKTKVSLPLLEGLEADDISRWPGGIFRRAFVRSYADCVGLDPDEIVRRFEEQHKLQEPEAVAPATGAGGSPAAGAALRALPRPRVAASQRARLLGTAADLAVAAVLAFGCAAAGSRLLWPVLLIAAYYAVGSLLTGTTPMVSLLSDEPAPQLSEIVEEAAPAPSPRPAERRQQPRRTSERPRQRRGAQAGARP